MSIVHPDKIALSRLKIDTSKDWLGYLIKNIGQGVDAYDAIRKDQLLLSLLGIDTHKDWGGYRIANIGVPTTVGDALRKGTRLTADEMLDGASGYVLTGQGLGVNPAYADIKQYRNFASSTLSSDFSTSSTTPVDTGMSVTITTKASLLVINVSGRGYSSTSGWDNRIRLDIVIDGVFKRGENFTPITANVPFHFAMVWMILVSAGSHTVKIQMSVNGGTGTLHGGTDGIDDFTLQVIELVT